MRSHLSPCPYYVTAMYLVGVQHRVTCARQALEWALPCSLSQKSLLVLLNSRAPPDSGVALGALHMVLLKTEPFLISLLLRGRDGVSGSLNICEAAVK